MLKGEDSILNIQFYLVDDLLYFTIFFDKMRFYLFKEFEKEIF